MTTSGAVNSPYAVADFKLETSVVETGVPIMVWRSVGNSHTEFARESALDELAIATGRDQVDLRRDLLAENPRTLHALELAAELGGWGTPLPEGRARGIAASSFLSHSAQVTEISARPAQPRPRRARHVRAGLRHRRQPGPGPGAGRRRPDLRAERRRVG